MKRIKFFACALALGLALVGCTGFYFGAASTPGDTSDAATAAQQSAPERVVLFDTDTLKITLDGLKNHRGGQARRDSVHIQKNADHPHKFSHP